MNRINRVILILIGMLLTASCASTPIKSLDLGVGKRTTTIKFEDPLLIPVPREEATEIKDLVVTGLFLFEHGRFEEATDWFLSVSEKISDKESELFQEVLMAAAVSAIVSGDRVKFTQVMEELNGRLSRFEKISMRDDRFIALNKLYEQIKENMKGELR